MATKKRGGAHLRVWGEVDESLGRDGLGGMHGVGGRAEEASSVGSCCRAMSGSDSGDQLDGCQRLSHVIAESSVSEYDALSQPLHTTTAFSRDRSALGWRPISIQIVCD